VTSPLFPPIGQLIVRRLWRGDSRVTVLTSPREASFPFSTALFESSPAFFFPSPRSGRREPGSVLSDFFGVPSLKIRFSSSNRTRFFSFFPRRERRSRRLRFFLSLNRLSHCSGRPLSFPHWPIDALIPSGPFPSFFLLRPPFIVIGPDHRLLLSPTCEAGCGPGVSFFSSASSYLSFLLFSLSDPFVKPPRARRRPPLPFPPSGGHDGQPIAS